MKPLKTKVHLDLYDLAAEAEARALASARANLNARGRNACGYCGKKNQITRKLRRRGEGIVYQAIERKYVVK